MFVRNTLQRKHFSFGIKVGVRGVLETYFGPLENVVRADVPPLFIEY